MGFMMAGCVLTVGAAVLGAIPAAVYGGNIYAFIAVLAYHYSSQAVWYNVRNATKEDFSHN